MKRVIAFFIRYLLGQMVDDMQLVHIRGHATDRYAGTIQKQQGQYGLMYFRTIKDTASGQQHTDCFLQDNRPFSMD